MENNVGKPERIVRGVLGLILLAVGLFVGRLTWWGVALDVAAGLLLLSATTGFCHVRMVFGRSCPRERGSVAKRRRGFGVAPLSPGPRASDSARSGRSARR